MFLSFCTPVNIVYKDVCCFHCFKEQFAILICGKCSKEERLKIKTPALMFNQTRLLPPSCTYSTDCTKVRSRSDEMALLYPQPSPCHAQHHQHPLHKWLSHLISPPPPARPEIIFPLYSYSTSFVLILHVECSDFPGYRFSGLEFPAGLSAPLFSRVTRFGSSLYLP